MASAVSAPRSSSPRWGWTRRASHRCAPGVVGEVPPGVKEPAKKKKGKGTAGRGNTYPARVLGEAAADASKTDSFLSERYRRIARRRVRKKAIVFVAVGPLYPGHHLASARRPTGPLHRPRPAPIPGCMIENLFGKAANTSQHEISTRSTHSHRLLVLSAAAPLDSVMAQCGRDSAPSAAQPPPWAATESDEVLPKSLSCR